MMTEYQPTKPKLRVQANSYFMIIASMANKKQFRIPVRGYNLSSMLAFEESLGLKHFYVEVPQEEYQGYYELTDTEDSVIIEPTKKTRKKKVKE
jgi:hypothetical protein